MQAGPSKEPTKGTPKNPKTPSRLNKTKRLQSSINLSQNLVQISASQRDNNRDYHAEKIALMQEDQRRRREYEAKKLAILQDTNQTLKQLLVEVKELIHKSKQD